MMLRRLLPPALLVLLVASCAEPVQDATVTMRPGVCDLTPSKFANGRVDFTIHNVSDVPIPFTLAETSSVVVRSVPTQGGETVTMRATLMLAHHYVPVCGGMDGPEITVTG